MQTVVHRGHLPRTNAPGLRIFQPDKFLGPRSQEKLGTGASSNINSVSGILVCCSNATTIAERHWNPHAHLAGCIPFLLPPSDRSAPTTELFSHLRMPSACGHLCYLFSTSLMQMRSCVGLAPAAALLLLCNRLLPVLPTDAPRPAASSASWC
jgi:hypothetical protein